MVYNSIKLEKIDKQLSQHPLYLIAVMQL